MNIFSRIILYIAVFSVASALAGYVWCYSTNGQWAFTRLACTYPEPVVTEPDTTPTIADPSPTPVDHPLIRVDGPVAGSVISSPLAITGEASGAWYFEASFPVVLVDTNNNVLAQGIATATSNWMTADFVPFTASLTFVAPIVDNQGTLILKKDNPTDDAANDDSVEVPVLFFQ